MEQTIDKLIIKLERVHALADVLLPLVEDNPKAQILATIIMELSVRPCN